jgi:hypothetical protein
MKGVKKIVLITETFRFPLVTNAVASYLRDEKP